MFSLVIPTYNRPPFLERLLRYYVDQKFPHPIVVADSSSGSALEANKQLITSLEGRLSITYRVFPADTAPYIKLSNTIASLSADYVAICADDDFIVPEGLAKCVDFLAANSTWAIAHGRTTAVLVSDPGEGSEILGASTYPQRTIDSDDPLARLKEHLSCHTATYYSVHRRGQLVSNLQQANDCTSDYRFGELLASCLSIVQGKAKCLDDLYMVRQAELGPATKKYSDKMLPWDSLLFQEDFSTRYSKFRNCLGKELSGACRISQEDAHAAIDRSFLSYLAQHLYTATGDDNWKTEMNVEKRKRMHRPLQRAYRAIATIPIAARVAIGDGKLFDLIRNPRIYYRQVLNMKQDDMSLPSLLSSRSRFQKQFMNVYRYLEPAAQTSLRDQCNGAGLKG